MPWRLRWPWHPGQAVSQDAAHRKARLEPRLAFRSVQQHAAAQQEMRVRPRQTVL